MVHTHAPGSAIVVTGASTGIGAACAAELDRRGFRVFAGVRSEADGQRLAATSSSRLVPVRLDVTVEQEIAAAAARVAEAVGSEGVAGLVNNAGIAVGGPLELLPIEKLRRQLEVNVIGQIAVTQAFLPLLRKSRGRIVNMSSVSGRIVWPYLGAYAASKFAMEALSDALRTELRNWAIHVALIEPGSIATPIWDKSLAAATALRQDGPAEARALYQADLDVAMERVRLAAARAIPVDRVVRAVVHALLSRRPRIRYPIGPDTRISLILYRLLPTRLWDRFLQRMLGLR